MVSTVTPPRIDTSLSVYAYVYIWWMKPYLSLRPLCFRFFVALKLRCFECTSPCCAASLSFISNQRSRPGSSAQLTVVVSARIHMDKPCEPCLGLYSFTHARAWWIRRRSSRAMRSEQKLHNGSKKMPFPYKSIHQSVLHKCSNAQMLKDILYVLATAVHQSTDAPHNTDQRCFNTEQCTMSKRPYWRHHYRLLAARCASLFLNSSCMSMAPPPCDAAGFAVGLGDDGMVVAAV